MKKLSRKEMKDVTGGIVTKTIWYCRDTPNLPYMTVGTCSTTDPYAHCGEYSCYNSNVVCTGAELCP
ncbi:bacteriocin-like protein [Mucilaginibacter sp.]|uniref:bacteriocin-like protein n=1 Tax=Mucilaginibacter sp. TaxID=1882438 RepID=UPI003D11A97E